MDKFENLDFDALELEEWEKTGGGSKPRYPFPTVTVTWDRFGKDNEKLMGRITFNTHASGVLDGRGFATLSFDQRYRLAGIRPLDTDVANAYMLQYYSYKEGNRASGASITATTYLRDYGIPAGRYRLVSGPNGVLLFDPDAPLEGE